MRLLLLQFVDYITNILYLMNFSVLQYDSYIYIFLHFSLIFIILLYN